VGGAVGQLGLNLICIVAAVIAPLSRQRWL
jgi:hypothetical protein